MSGRPYRQLTWSDVDEGDELPGAIDHLDVERIVMGAAATWTYFGGHIDAEYARTQGRAHIYMPTGPILGMVDAYVTAWAGPEAFLAKRSVRMVDSLYAGDDAHFRGVVTKKWTDASTGGERHLIEVEVQIQDGSGRPCVFATTRFALPPA